MNPEVCLSDVPVDPTLTAFCPTANVAITAADLTGSLMVSADLFWTNSVAGTVTTTIQVPATCLEQRTPIGVFRLTCAQVEGLVPGGGAACADDGLGCLCVVTSDYSDVDSGSMTLANGVATVNGANGANTYEYCVDDDELFYRQIEGSAAPGLVVALTRE
ncbi:MAG: hypothetical protein FJ137_18185 [Deltaproteobacteria bacterium]|nr:hypothetical protein [Deltaproteobacteria bacterium]